MGEVGEVGGVGGIMLVKLLGRQRRLESPEAATRNQLVAASLISAECKELNGRRDYYLILRTRQEKICLWLLRALYESMRGSKENPLRWNPDF